MFSFGRGSGRMRRTHTRVILLCLVGAVVTACASAPPPRPVKGYTPAVGDKAADTALTMVGKPYRYRGETPAGFDCSGLVRYSYLVSGVDVPHGTKNLMYVTRPVSRRSIRKGDLLFFLQEGKRYSHVGIYIGDDRFVHAPSSGKTVRTDELTDPYWKKHLLDARRFI
jgi:cell wall-associated NlpC family hydrolase